MFYKKPAPKYAIRYAVLAPPPAPAKKKSSKPFPYFLFAVSLFCCWFVYFSLAPVLPEIAEPPRFYSNQSQQDLRQVMIDAIRSARTSISLVIFGLTDKAILGALAEKIAQGVDTTIYYDPTGSPNIHKILQGGHIYPVHCKGLMHHKILILDEETVFIGSANMTTHSLKMHDNLVLGLVNQKVARFLKEHIPYSSGYVRAMVGGQELELWLLPDNRGKALSALRKRLKSATQSICLALFTITHKGIVEELIRAHERGVKVTVVVDMHSGLGASGEVVEKLRTAGVRLLFSQGTQLLHHKFAYIDEQTLIMGSANWTKAAFTKNGDSLLILPTLNESQKTLMNRLWKRIESEAKLQIKQHKRS